MRTSLQHMMCCVLCALSMTACGSLYPPTGLKRSNAHLARAGTGAVRAGFGMHVNWDPNYSTFPVVQGMGGLDLGSRYALHAFANSTQFGADGLLFAVNTPMLRIGVVHGFGGRFTSGSSSGSRQNAEAGLGPTISFGKGVIGFVVGRVGWVGSRVDVNPDGRFATSFSGSGGVSFPWALAPTLELGVSTLYTDGYYETAYTVGVTFMAEVAR